MTVPTLTTERLVLRQIRADDAQALHGALADPALMTYWSSAPHDRLEQTEAYVASNAEISDGFLCWAITLSRDKALGWVVLIEKRKAVYEIGYILHRDHWGRGFAREAVSSVIAHGFGAMGARRIFADVDPDNTPSIQLLEACGFQREGHLRGEWETHIGIRDSLIFGLLCEEWVARSKA